MTMTAKKLSIFLSGIELPVYTHITGQPLRGMWESDFKIEKLPNGEMGLVYRPGMVEVF
jgi:hypothetical protein